MQHIDVGDGTKAWIDSSWELSKKCSFSFLEPGTGPRWMLDSVRGGVIYWIMSENIYYQSILIDAIMNWIPSEPTCKYTTNNFSQFQTCWMLQFCFLHGKWSSKHSVLSFICCTNLIFLSNSSIYYHIPDASTGVTYKHHQRSTG